MTALGRRHWRDFWADQTTPLHSAGGDPDYEILGACLRLLFAGHGTGRVLEVGCGSGTLFRPLGFDRADRYLGVDFSAAMLARFHARFPGVELVEADAARFRADETFDLVFSSYVAQYLDRDQLGGHLGHARAMIADGGLVVVTGIPWSRMRVAYARGDLFGGPAIGSGRRSLPRTALALARELAAPAVGHWYDLGGVAELAERHGFRATFWGDSYYPYRFHAVLMPLGMPFWPAERMAPS